MRSSPYVGVCSQCRCPCAPPIPPLRDSSSDDERPAIRKADALVCCLSPGYDNEKAGQGQLFFKMTDPEGDEIKPRISQLLGSLPHDSPQRDSLLPTPAQATWQQPQPQPRDLQTFPAGPGVYHRSQYNRQDTGPSGNHRTITVGYAFIHHKLAPSHSIYTDINLGQENDAVFGAEDKIPNPTLAAKSLHFVSDSEVEEEIVSESDLEIGSELQCFEAASGEYFSRDLGVPELPSAERGCDSGTTSECLRSPLSDLYEDVLESCSPTYNSDARHSADFSLIRMQEGL